MLLKDVLKVVGESELGSFPWGRSVVSVVNGFVDEEYQISLKSKGDDVNRAIESIPEEGRETVLSARMRADGYVALNTTSVNDDVVAQERSRHNTKAIAVFVFISSLCFIAIVMTMTTTHRHYKSGEPMETSWLVPLIEGILSALQTM